MSFAVYDIGPLVRRGVITLDPTKKLECCGMPRDDDGFCIHRPGHPIYVESVTIGVIHDGKSSKSA